jgi:hypothetical protein
MVVLLVDYPYNVARVVAVVNEKVVKRMSRRLFLLRGILTRHNHAIARNRTSLDLSIVIFPENEIVSHDSLLDYIYNLARARDDYKSVIVKRMSRDHFEI